MLQAPIRFVRKLDPPYTLLVERVEIGVDGLNVRLRVEGLSGLAREMLAGGIGEAA